MTSLLDVYGAQFKAVLEEQLQYRVLMAIGLLWLVLQPVIYLAVWSAVARAHGGSVGGYTRAQFAAYFLAVMLVNHLTFTWALVYWEGRVRRGLLSPLLLLPIHPIHHDLAATLMYKLMTLVVILPAAAGLVVAFHPAVHPTPWMVVAFLFALLLAAALRFLVEWTLGLLALWVTRMSAVRQLYAVALLFLSGQVAPLSLFPLPIQTATALLPFRWMVAFPVDVLLGRETAGQTLIGLAAQGTWVVLTLALLAITWRAGLRRYVAVGL
jgi:ABC-2 type transport system permease protein